MKHRLRMRILWILRFLKIHKFLRISKMVMNFKNKIRHCEKLAYRWDRNLWCEVANIKIQLFIEKNSIVMWGGANIGLLEHVQCTCMSDSPKMSITKFKYKLQTCKIKSSKLSSLIDSFRLFINQTCSMKHGIENSCRNEFLRILKR